MRPEPPARTSFGRFAPGPTNRSGIMSAEAEGAVLLRVDHRPAAADPPWMKLRRSPKITRLPLPLWEGELFLARSLRLALLNDSVTHNGVVRRGRGVARESDRR